VRAELAALGELEEKAFKDCTYLNVRSVGVSVLVKKGRVDSVFLYGPSARKDDKMAVWPHALPHDLRFDLTVQNVVEKWGEPSEKTGGGRHGPIAIQYDKQGVELTFVGQSWEDKDNPVAFVALFAPAQETDGLCSRCMKVAGKRCGVCQAVWYCSTACQKQDWSSHKLVCKVPTLCCGA
jgi:hypothetical protein